MPEEDEAKRFAFRPVMVPDAEGIRSPALLANGARMVHAAEEFVLYFFFRPPDAIELEEVREAVLKDGKPRLEDGADVEIAATPIAKFAMTPSFVRTLAVMLQENYDGWLEHYSQDARQSPEEDTDGTT